MKILITGGTGFVGQRLLKKLHSLGHQCVVLTRNPEKAKLNESTDAVFYRWDGVSEDVPAESSNGIDAVVNLMGENIANKRWTDRQKKILQDSRIKATQCLINKIEEILEKPLKVFISASAIGYYPINSSEQLDESSSVGSGFLSQLCVDWEGATDALNKTERKIIMRTGVILGPEAGALNKLLPIFKLGGGGPIGNGKMIMSWISVDDMVKAIVDFLTHDKYRGTYNMVAPNPVPNSEFTKALAKQLNRPAFFPVPPFALKALMGEMSTIVLDSQNVYPKRLIEDGFEFDSPTIDQAFSHLLG